MAKEYEVLIRVVSQKGTCSQGHKVGDEWAIRERKTPEGMCISAFNALYSNARVLMFDGVLPWTPDPDVSEIACPDVHNPVVFEIRRLRK